MEGPGRSSWMGLKEEKDMGDQKAVYGKNEIAYPPMFGRRRRGV